jgi:polar amino acid transport system permease protein
MFAGLPLMFNFSGALEYLPALLLGALISVELTSCVMALSLVFGLLLALGKLSRSRVLSTASNIYIELIRGTPALLQLFYIYFVLQSVGIRVEPFLRVS